MPLLELSEHLLQLVRVLSEGGASGDHRVQSLEELDTAILRNPGRIEGAQPPGVEGILARPKRLVEGMERLRRVCPLAWWQSRGGVELLVGDEGSSRDLPNRPRNRDPR